MAQIPDVKIVLDGAEGYTNEDGVVVFTGNGEYSWTASKEGYVTKSGTVTLDHEMSLEIKLDPTPPIPPPISMGSMLSICLSLLGGGIASILYGKE